ncbi:MAG: M81 family metallopeptidase [Planctomycetaceae bacterium]|nr:M81 family metallopeptidase [Planctomycetaceae bacterium]
MRVGILSIQHESNTFLPAVTTYDSFRSCHLYTGDAIRAAYGASHHELGGFLTGLASADIEAVPIYAAWANPSGTITADACQRLTSELFAALEQTEQTKGPLDGFLIAPHGAAVGESEPDFDGAWIGELRRRVGPDRPIISTLDPHGNLSPRMVAACTAMIAYRSNPHLDQRDRGLEAARLMARTLRGEVRPTMAACFPPLAINIERQLTSASPCRELYELANEQLSRPGVLGNSVMLGFPYSDVAEMGSSLIAITDYDPALAQQLANELGQHLWLRRLEFRGQLTSVERAVQRAMSIPGPIGLLDMGDNVGGGSPGDSTLLLHAIIQAGVTSALAVIYDAPAVEQAVAARVGGKLTLSVGGQTDRQHGAPVTDEATVLSLHDGHFSESEARHGGRTQYDQGRSAVIKLRSGPTILLTSLRMPPFSLAQITSCGLIPQDFQLIVIKGVHAPVAAYAPVCRELIRVDTGGVTCADMTRLPFTRRRQPLFPFDDGFEWSP